MFFDSAATLAAAKALCLDALPSLNDSNQMKLIVTLIVLIIVASSAVVLRVYCRKISRVQLGLDDYLIIISLVN